MEDDPHVEIEKALKASQSHMDVDEVLDFDALEDRAHMEVGVRDIITFGFANMMSAMLLVVARACGLVLKSEPDAQANKPKTENIQS